MCSSAIRDAVRRGASVVLAAVLALVLAAGLIGCDEAASTPSPSVAAIDLLIQNLRSGTRTERAAAADDLATLADPDAIPALTTSLADTDWNVRWRAAEALVTLHDTRAVEPLLAFIAVAPAEPDVAGDDMWDADAAFEAAIHALGAIGDVRAVPRLIEIAAVEDSTTASGAAADALAVIGAAAVPGIETALGAADTAHAVLTVPLLARAGDAGFAPLAAALGDRRAAVRIAAAGAITEYGADAVDPLLGALDGDDRALRVAVAAALGDLGDVRATKALVGLLADTKLVGAATTALVQIHKDDAAPLLPYLKAARTVGVYRALIRIGQDDTASELVKALTSFGSKTMGEAYLNCGNPTLEQAAKAWAKRHGYTVVTHPGSGAEAWGGG